MPSQNVVEIVFQGIDQVSKNVNDISSRFQSLGRLAVRVGGGIAAAFTVKNLIQTADTMQLLENRLRIVTTGTENLAAVQAALFNVAENTRGSYEATVDLYARVARNSEALGLSQSQLLDITTSVNQAIQISGASAVEASAGLTQLGQALGSGTLRGDELRSILEQLPRLAEAIASGMGVTIGELRTLGGEGKLTSQAVVNAIKDQAAVLNEEYQSMTTTISQATTLAGNSFARIIQRMDDATGASDFLVGAIEEIVDGAEDMADALLGTLDPTDDVREGLKQTATVVVVLTSVIQGLLDVALFIPKLFGEMGRSLGAFAAAANFLRKGEFRAALSALSESGQDTADEIRSLMTDTFEDIADIAENASDRISKIWLEGFRDPQIDPTEALNELEAQIDERINDLKPVVINAELRTNIGYVADELKEIELINFDGRVVTRWKSVTAAADEFSDELKSIREQGLRNIQDAMAEFLFDPFEDGLKGMVVGFIDAIRTMVAQAAAAKLIEHLFSKDSSGSSGGGGGGGGGNIFSSIFSGLLGGGKARGGFTTPGMIHPVEENEPEFLLTGSRSHVVPLSKAAAVGVGGVGGGGGMVFAPHTEFHTGTSMTREEMEMFVLERENRMLADFKQMMNDGELG